MNEQARRIWKTPDGAGLLRKMLAGGPLDAQDRHTLANLKRADPPKLAQAPSPEAVSILAAMMVRRVQRLQHERDDGNTPPHAKGKQTLAEVQQTTPTKPRKPASED